MNGKLAITYYYAMHQHYSSMDDYSNQPHLMKQLAEALGIENDIKIPDKMGWGDGGKLIGKMAKIINKKYTFEYVLEELNPFFHVVFYDNRIAIIGTDLCSGISREIPCKTGIKSPSLSVGYDLKAMNDHNSRLKRQQFITKHITENISRTIE